MAIIDFNSSIWSKPWFRKLPANAKILFIYLWTNNHKNLIGMYEIDFDTIQFETGLSKKQIEDTLSILYPKIKYDINKEIVWIVNHVQHQFMRTPNISPKIITGIEKCLISLDNHSFVDEFIKRYDTLSIQYTYCSGGGEGVRCIGEGKGDDKEEIEVSNNIYQDYFNKFWEIIPPRNGKRIDKPAAEKKFLNLKESDLPLIIQATTNYANSENVKKGIGIKDPHRFISNRDNPEYWKEWIEPEVAMNRADDKEVVIDGVTVFKGSETEYAQWRIDNPRN